MEGSGRSGVPQPSGWWEGPGTELLFCCLLSVGMLRHLCESAGQLLSLASRQFVHYTGEVRRSVEDGATLGVDEPLLGLLLGDALELAGTAGACAAAGDALAGAAEDDVEVHAENTGGVVVPDAEVDVLVDTEAEVT